MIERIEDRARGVALEVIVAGAGPDVVLVPSSLRGAADFADLQARLAGAGFRTLAINPRGTAGSTAAQSGLTLAEVIDDIAFVIDRLGRRPAHVVGHALGSIFARALASLRPEMVRSVVAMPCGGQSLDAHPVPAEVLHHFARCHDMSLPAEARLESLGIAFFAPANDASSWLDGWWPQAHPVSLAAGRSDPETWWRAGNAPLLIIQPLADRMAPPVVGREVVAALGDRVEYVEVADCGHAILPEQPVGIAGLIADYLRRQG